MFDTANQFARGTFGQYGNGYGAEVDESVAPSHGHNVLNDWLHPATKEYRNMAQQLMMEEMTPQAKMAGMKAAGINPLTAAAGIAGGSASMPQPSQSTNPIGDVAGAVGAVSGGVEALTNSTIGLRKLPDELENIRSDTKSKLEAAGLTHAEAEGVITDNKYRDENWKSELNVKRQQFENMKQEYTNMQANHRLIMAKVDESISQIELNGSIKDYQDAMAAKVAEETRWMTEVDNWRIKNKLYITESGVDGYIFSLIARNADLKDFDTFIDTYSKYRDKVSYAEQKGISQAERRYGTSKSPWEMGDKYLSRFIDWVNSNGEVDPEAQREQIYDIMDRLQSEHPDWDRDRIIKELYSFGLSKDAVYNALK